MTIAQMDFSNSANSHKISDMAPRRKSPAEILAARQALRAHTNALKLEAAQATISQAARTAATSKSLSTRTAAASGGRISKKPTKKSATAEKRGSFLRKIQTGASGKAPVLAAASSRRRVVMPKVKTSMESIVAESLKPAEAPVKNSLDGVVTLSKSARKRKNRAVKEKLAGNDLTELMDALPETEQDDGDDAMDEDMEDGGAVAGKGNAADVYLDAKHDRPVSLKAGEKVVKQEIDRFGKVMTEATFRENPFAALRGFIQQRI
ncbi:ribosome biogenesis protein SLX9-domain-containing protein [Myxozyma melibiosi]|uniref:Ribosome biogenesis protein SLX9 n=1 Tax=Myxozyma melibiosi TaxID=54550 RepID=A0ABR1FD30_9ASCO